MKRQHNVFMGMVAAVVWSSSLTVALATSLGPMEDATDFWNEDQCESGCGSCAGMPQWTVSEPHINLWVHDIPFQYQPAKGPAVRFKLSYKQREDVTGASPNEFSVGRQWNCSWLSYLDGYSFKVLMPGGGLLDFAPYYGAQEYFTGGKLEWGASSYQVVFPDGRTNIYGFGCPVESSYRYYLTEQSDSAGNSLRFEYDPDSATVSVARLLRVIDGDGGTNTIHYADSHPWSTNLIDHITDRFGHTNALRYDAEGRLTNVVDVVGLPASFKYDDANWITNLTTPYGTTSFEVTVDDPNEMRALKVTDASGGGHLWVYPGLTNAVPNLSTNGLNTEPFTTALGERVYTNNNSFYWGPKQFETLTHTDDPANLTAVEYVKGRRQHWLAVTGNRALSMQQDFSPDGANPGQQTWFDYPMNGESPTQRQPLMVVRRLPGTNTWFNRTERNEWGLVTRAISTYTTESGTPGLRTNTFEYYADGQHMLLAKGPDGEREAGYEYSDNLLLSSTNALGEVTRYTYNGANQPTSVSRPGGLVTTNLYLTSGAYAGWLTNTIDVVNGTPQRTNSYSYTNALVWTHTDERGLSVTNTWDALGRLVRVAYPDGTFITNGYENLDLVRTLDRLGFTNSFGYDALRRMTAATNALGRVTLYSYCNCGVLDSVTEAYGTALARTNTHYYDAASRRTNSVSSGDSFSVKTVYDLPGRVVSTSDSAGNSVTNYYNLQGQRYAASNALGQVFFAKFDLHDRVTEQTDANGITVTNTYDAAGRLLTRSYPGGGGVEKYGYTLNVAGPVSYTNQLNQPTFYGYDAYGRKTAETNANTEVLRFTYTPAGDLATLTDGKTQVTTWQYDRYGHVTNKLDNLSATAFRYGYDADGRLTNRWTPAKGGIATGYRYDAGGNLTNVDYPNSADLTLTYDALNRLSTLVDGVGTSSYSYTSWGGLASEDGPWDSDTVSYSYTTRRRTGLGVPVPGQSDWSASYGWDTVGRLTNVTSSAGSFGYRYAAGQPSSVAAIALPGGSFITNTFDPLARLLSTTLLAADNTVLNAHSYELNTGNQRTAVTNVAGNIWQYGYDNIGQLLSANGRESSGGARAHEQFDYAYDAAWNLLRRTNGSMVATFSVDSLNQLTGASRTATGVVAGVTWAPATNVTVAANGGAAVSAARYADWTWARTNVSYLDGTNTFVAVAQDSYGRADTNSVTLNLPATNSMGYDANGNTTTNGTQLLAYDDENRMVTNWVPGAWKAEHVYDGQNRRRIERNYTWNNGAWQLASETRFIYDGNVVIQERDGNNAALVTLARGLDLSGSFQGAGGIGGLLAMTDYSTLNPQLSTALYHSDGNGNVTCLIGTNGVVVARYHYAPFGAALAMSGPKASANRYRFSSKPTHEPSGMYDYLYRWYAPELQRWVNRDPIEEDGGVNMYTMSGNAIVNRTDSYGLHICPKNECRIELFVNHYRNGLKAIFDSRRVRSPIVGYIGCGANKLNYAQIINGSGIPGMPVNDYQPSGHPGSAAGLEANDYQPVDRVADDIDAAIKAARIMAREECGAGRCKTIYIYIKCGPEQKQQEQEYRTTGKVMCGKRIKVPCDK